MRRTLIPILIRIACACVFLGGSMSQAAQPESEAAKPPRIRIAISNFPPWTFKDASGHYTGILTEYLRDIARDAGVELVEQVVPLGRLHHSVNKGKVDMFFSIHRKDELECCQLLGAMFETETVILSKKAGPAWNPEADKKHFICRTSLSGYALPGFQMFDADSLHTCVRMVARDRLPFMVGERLSLTKVLDKQPPDVRALLNPPQVIGKRQFHLHIAKSVDVSPYGPLLRQAAAKRKLSDYFQRFMATPP